MKKGRRLLALVVAVSLLVGLAPFSMGNEVKAASEPTLRETVVFSDAFEEGTSWDTTSGKWYLGLEKDLPTVGVRNGTAPLGSATSTRNLCSQWLGDVHVGADVYVIKDECYGSNVQYHFIFARGNTLGINSVAFGLKTTKNATKSSLVIGYYNGNDSINVWHETQAVYDLNTTHELDLYVVGSLVMAKCNGQTVYLEERTEISEKGHCGIMDRRATSNPTGTTYGTDYTKAGYFDNFTVGTVEEIIADGFKINGPVVIAKDGTGVADITLVFDGEDGATIEDAVVTVDALKNKETNLYEGEYTISTTISGTEKTSIAKRVFVVDDLSKTVTKMNDSRWTGASATAVPKFTVDANGKATLTPSGSAAKGISTLNVGTANGAYGNFYAEYTLTMTDLAAEARGFVDSFLCMDSYGNPDSNAWGANLFFDNRASQAPNSTFWARLRMSDGSVNQEYSKTFADPDIEGGKPVKIGMLVYDNTITLMINGVEAVTYTGTEAYKGWFGIAQSGTAGKTTIENFVYVPLADKKMIDIEVSEIPDVQLYEDVQPSAVPVYSWPNDKGEATTEGVTVTGFNKAKAGKQTITVSYEGFSKQVDVNVVDKSVETIVSEDFTENPFSDTTVWAKSSGVVVSDGKASMEGTASAKTAIGVESGYIEANVAIKETRIANGASDNPMTFYYSVDGNSEIKVRFSVAKNNEGEVTVKLNMFAYDDANSPAFAPAVTLSDFEWNKEYKIRLTCIGNYIEVRVNGEVVSNFQRTLSSTSTIIDADGYFGFENSTNTTVTMDDLKIVKYTPYALTKGTTISLPEYSFTQITDTSKTNERTAFYAGEEIIITTDAEQQLSATGGLAYSIIGTTQKYPVSQRLYGAGLEKEVCNKFVLNMPASDIALNAEYYTVGTEDANIGIKEVSIREKTSEKDYGLRFSSRAYKTYVSNGVTYELKEVGTLLFNDKAGAITNDMLDACRQSGDEYKNSEDVIIGKCVTAKHAQDICNDFMDWGVILTYGETSELFATDYTAHSYAKYVAVEGTGEPIYVYGAPTTHSYNEVATLVGYETR